MAGVYFLADFCSGVISGLRRDAASGWESSLLFEAPFLVSTFGAGEDGELFVANYGPSGAMFRVTADSALPPLPNRRIAPGIARD
jgi:hypothetical protein